MSIETLLRDSLAAEAESVAGTRDPWPGFRTRERRHRRRRAVRRTALIAVVAALAGAQSGLVPLPGGTPGIAIATRSELLADSPTRGSLAGDLAWQEGMRRAVRDVRDPGEIWRVGDRSKIKMLYVSNFGDSRTAVMMVPLRFGFVTDWAVITYHGPAGAAPEQMEEGARQDASRPVVVDAYTRSDGPGRTFLLAPAGTDIWLSQGFRYTPEGRVERGAPVRYAHGTGVVELRIPSQPLPLEISATVKRGSRVLYQGGLGSGWAGGSSQEISPAVVARALGGRSFDVATMQGWVSAALSDARWPASGTSVAVRWTGTVRGRPAALFTLRRAGTGVLGYAYHGDVSSFRQDLRVLLPAAGAESRPLAWRLRAEGGDTKSSEVMVVAPPAADRLAVIVAGADPVELQLDAGGSATTTLDPATAARVVAYRGDHAIGETPILPFEQNMGGLPGESPST